jgi:hypothetical protein
LEVDMLGALKNLFSNASLGASPYAAVSAWAQRRGHVFKRARDAEGFAIDGTLEDKAWRFEWGPPQRPYIVGNELRARMELGLPEDLQMLLLSRPLLEALERETYERFTLSNQTELGDSQPDEVRWLVMFPKISLSAHKGVRTRFGGVSNVEGEGLSWIEGPLAKELLHATQSMLASEPPFVMTTLRGRLYLRLQLATPDADDIAEALGLLETAASEAMRVGAKRPQETGDWEAGAASTWQSVDPGRRRGAG